MADNNDKQQDGENDALLFSALGSRVRIPAAWAAWVGPWLKWSILAVSAGLFIVLTCYGVSLVIKL